jgi:competence ComEA-like helix-hairpin-helix protein
MSIVRSNLMASLVALLVAASLFSFGSAHAESGASPGVININQATVEQLMFLPRVGESKALRIVEHRTKSPFKTVNELARVKGIGLKSLRHLKPFIRVEGPTTLTRKLTKEDMTASTSGEGKTEVADKNRKAR